MIFAFILVLSMSSMISARAGAADSQRQRGASEQHRQATAVQQEWHVMAISIRASG